MRKKYLTIPLTLITLACASTHPGQLGQSIYKENKLPLKISAKEIKYGGRDNFKLIDMTLENTDEKWLRISKARVITEETPGVNVVLGKDLYLWAEAALNQAQINAQNRNMVLGVLLLAGSAALIASHRQGHSDSTLAAAGATAAGSAVVINAVDEITTAKRKAEESKRITEDHLYSPTAVPGKMFLRRWVLINKPSATPLHKVLVEFETEEGVKDTYAVNF